MTTGNQIPVSNSRIKLSSGQIFWREVGSGPHIVFLHGAWTDSSDWLPVIETLSHECHCLAPDLLGFGESDQPETHYSISLEVECLAEYLKALSLHEVYLVARDLGAWVATSYALQHPEAVRGLVLLAPYGVEIKAAHDASKGKQGSWLEQNAHHVRRLLLLVYPLAKLLRCHRPIERLLPRLETMLSSRVAREILFARRRAEIEAELLHDHFDSLNTPVLVLQGEADTPRVVALCTAYAQLSPQVAVRIVPGNSEDAGTITDSLALQIREFVIGL